MSSMPDLSEFDVRSQLSHEEAAQLAPLATDKLTFNKAYWRRPDGTIRLGEYWPVELMRNLSLGRQPLLQYGEFNERDLRGDPWRVLFLRGGAKELPLSQVLELGWHRNPPRYDEAGNLNRRGKPVVFPQLDSDEARALIAQEEKCQYCHKTYLNRESLTNHQRVAHRDVSQQASLARALGDVLGNQKPAESAPTTNDAMIALLTKLVDRVEALEKRPAK